MLSKNQLGFFYMFISVCAFSLMDVIVKWSDEYPVGEVLFFRGFFGIIPLLFLIPKDRYFDFYKTNRPLLHLKRCLAGLIALMSIFIALRNLPLATVVSISFAAPIFTTIFSIFLLNEKVGFYRWLAVLVGFIGIIVISEPGFSSLNLYYIYPIIFCLNDRQKEISEKIIKEENIKFSGKIVTKTSLVKNYCPAEEYHQKYLEKR